MRKIILSLFTAVCISATGLAQGNIAENNARIENILKAMPVNDSVQFNTQMNSISELGEDGLLSMISMLSDPATKDKSKLEYAINGYTTFATKSGNEAFRKNTVSALCRGLTKVNDKEQQAFIITQLEIAAKDDAVSCVRSYLSDARLADPAARVLVRINTPLAKDALFQAARQVTGSARLSLIEALGDVRYRDAAELLHPLVSAGDKNLQKVSIYALANIADPSSEQVLAAAAEKAGWVYDFTHATSGYIVYAQNLAANGHAAQAEKIANNILQKASSETAVHTRIAALKIIADVRKENSISSLVQASVNDNADYRAAALQFAADYLTPANIALWVKQAKKARPEMKTAIIAMLGNNDAQNAQRFVLKSLKSRDKAVKLAAIEAAGKIGQDGALKPLLKVMKTGDDKDAEAVMNALLIMKGDDVTDVIAREIDDMPAFGQVRLISVLANRGEPDKLDVIYPLLNSRDVKVRKAAYASLRYLVTKDHVRKLFTLFNESADYDDLMDVQEAIIISMRDDETASYDVLILQEIEAAPAEKKMYFYNMLAYLGGEKPLQIVSDAFSSGDERNRSAALKALTLWSDSTAADKLFAISTQTTNADYFNTALTGYVRAVSSAGYPAAQKFEMLRRAMEIAKTTKQKDLILQEVEKTNSYPALVFAGKYLDDPDLQHRAGLTIMNIALANKSFYGKEVRDLLNRTILVLKGRDGEFQKQSIRKHLSDMPEGEPGSI